jgi:hypothetical protein
MFHDVPPGIVTGCLTEPTSMIIHGLVSPETHYFAAQRAVAVVAQAVQIADPTGSVSSARVAVSLSGAGIFT